MSTHTHPTSPDPKTSKAPADDGEATPEQLHEISEIFAALSDPTRLRIIYSILDRERRVGEIARLLELSEPSVSQHLRRLRALKVVTLRREGRYRAYQIADAHVEHLLSVCLEHVSHG